MLEKLSAGIVIQLQTRFPTASITHSTKLRLTATVAACVLLVIAANISPAHELSRKMLHTSFHRGLPRSGAPAPLVGTGNRA